MKAFFVILFSAFCFVGFAKVKVENLRSPKDEKSKTEQSLKKKMYTVPFAVGPCIGSATVSGPVGGNWFYSWAVNCAGYTVSGSGQFKITTSKGGKMVIDSSTITYEYDSESTKTDFESNNGKENLQSSVNSAFEEN